MMAITFPRLPLGVAFTKFDVLPMKDATPMAEEVLAATLNPRRNRIHPMSCIAPGARIGAGTTVWQFASVIRHAEIGDHCTIGAGAIVDAALVGDGCSIGAGAQIHPGTWLGDNVFIGPGAIICNDMWPQTRKDGFDMDELLNRVAFTVRIHDDAVICAGAIILPGVTIGEGAMVAAGAVCDVSLPKGALLRRDGTIDSVPEDRAGRRMRYAAC